MKNPIGFKDRLNILGILFIICTVFLLLDQIPLVDDLLSKFSEYMELEFGYIY